MMRHGFGQSNLRIILDLCIWWLTAYTPPRRRLIQMGVLPHGVVQIRVEPRGYRTSEIRLGP